MTDVASQQPAEGDEGPVLTNRQGHPVFDNQNQRTVGARGPATLENYQFLEKISHFDRERDAGAGRARARHHRLRLLRGVRQRRRRAHLARTRGPSCSRRRASAPISRIRFSTVAGGRDSSEMARDPRGFAVKFYTEDGNWDLVGNNLGVFFIRDAIKFPDFIHSHKPDPVTFEASVANRAFDFFSQSPEALHMVTLVFSPRGIPATYRHQQGFGVNTYKWVNEAGDTKLVKYHWLPKQGVRILTAEDAAEIQAADLGHHTKDLYDAIDARRLPGVGAARAAHGRRRSPGAGLRPARRHEGLAGGPVPAAQAIGRMVLDRKPENFFAESEQIAFGTGVLVDGLDFSDDKMLRRPDVLLQRHAAPPGRAELPAAAGQPPAGAASPPTSVTARWPTASTWRRAQNPHVNYEPSILGGLREATARRTTSRGRRSAGA